MLGLDLLILIVVNAGITIYMVSVNKGDDYFENVKKEYAEDNNVTYEGIADASQNNLNPRNSINFSQI